LNDEKENRSYPLDPEEVVDQAEQDLLWRYLKAVPAFRALLRSVESRFYQHIELPEPVLDLGCGDGLFAHFTFPARLTAGIDPWWSPLQKAKREESYEVLIQSQGQSLPIADDYFASVISNSVLEHIADIQPVLHEINRVLRPGGRLVVTMPNHLFSRELAGATALEKIRLKPLANQYRQIFNKIARHAHVDHPQTWAERFASVGFEIERWQDYFSIKALHALEIGHLQGIPSAIIHALTGHWIVAPWQRNLHFTERWVRPYFEEQTVQPGTMTIFILRKAARGPVPVVLPPSSPLDLSQASLARTFLVTPAVNKSPDEIELENTAPPSPARIDEVHSETDEGSATKKWWVFPRGASGIALLTVAILSAAIGVQIVRDGAGLSLSAVFWLACSALLLILSNRPGFLSQVVKRASAALRKMPHRRWLILTSFALVLLADRTVNDPASIKRPFLSLIFWLIAILIAFFALWDWRTRKVAWGKFQPRQSWEIPVVLILSIFALIVRLVGLTSHPFILSGSEASIGLDAWSVAKEQIQSPFAAAWLTNPTMPLYLLAVPLELLGRTVLAVRILSPIIGAITVVALYLVGRRLWGPVVGLIAASLLAGSHVHVHYSRIGMTNIWDPLLALLAIGLIYAAWQDRNRLLWLAAGIVTGLNAYTYTSSHLIPFILAGIFLLMLRDRREVWEQRSDIFAATLMVFVVAFPQLLYYREYPAIYLERVNTLGIFQSGWFLREGELTAQNPFQVLIKQFWRGVLAFQAGNDNSTAYNPGVPILGFLPAVISIIGVGYAVTRFKQLRYAILIIWVGVTLLFASVLLESPPNSHRLVIALPAVYLLISLATVWLLYRGLAYLKISRRYLIPVIVAVVALIVAGDLFFYFGDYRTQRRYGDRNTEIANEVSVYLDSLEEQWTVYFYGAPSMFSNFPTFAYLVEDFGVNIKMIDVEESAPPPPAMPGTNTVYIFLPERSHEIAQVQELFQGGELRVLQGFNANPLSYIYELHS
jgi:SAM-dependent methyltransferase/4-amino-4-deoxy-L-arabinose transferase-like glycosyltransferase